MPRRDAVRAPTAERLKLPRLPVRPGAGGSHSQRLPASGRTLQTVAGHLGQQDMLEEIAQLRGAMRKKNEVAQEVVAQLRLKGEEANQVLAQLRRINPEDKLQKELAQLRKKNEDLAEALKQKNELLGECQGRLSS